MSVTRDGHMTKYRKDGTSYPHYSSHGNRHEVEVSIVFQLHDMSSVSPRFANDPSTRRKIEALEAKAAQMRAAKAAKETT